MKVVTSSLLAGTGGVRHAFFTRHGGVSTGLYDSLNVGRGSRDEPDDVAENRRRAAACFGQPAERLLTCYQIHSAQALIADGPWPEAPQEGDGVVTRETGLICGALSADCAPILIADPVARVVAAAHAGWKGALTGIIASAVEQVERLGASRGQMVAAVGPCIGPASYEVGLEYLDRFVAADAGNVRFFSAGAAPDKRQFDLPGFVLERLRAAGVSRCEWTGHDTCADADFFSNRRAVKRGEGDYGRLLTAIMLTSPG